MYYNLSLYDLATRRLSTASCVHNLVHALTGFALQLDVLPVKNKACFISITLNSYKLVLLGLDQVLLHKYTEHKTHQGQNKVLYQNNGANITKLSNKRG